MRLSVFLCVCVWAIMYGILPLACTLSCGTVSKAMPIFQVSVNCCNIIRLTSLGHFWLTLVGQLWLTSATGDVEILVKDSPTAFRRVWNDGTPSFV
jgi:hypothetical protein